eukprot:362044-Chlamydomonas_euryale.AAC.15
MTGITVKSRLLTRGHGLSPPSNVIVSLASIPTCTTFTGPPGHSNALRGFASIRLRTSYRQVRRGPRQLKRGPPLPLFHDNSTKAPCRHMQP